MAIETVATSLGGTGLVPAPGSEVGQGLGGQASGGSQTFEITRPSEAAAPRAVALETRTARVGGPAETPLRPRPVPEVNAGPQRDGPSIGNRVIHRMDSVQRGDTAWSMRSRAPQTSGGEPTLRVPARESGPASAQLRPAPSDASATVQPNQQPGQSRNAGFDHMVDQLQQVSDQVVQVSIVSKTTSSFTGSLNKLLSSG